MCGDKVDGSGTFGPGMRNRIQLPVWRVAFCRRWWFPTSCYNVVSLGEMPPQSFTFSRWKGDYTLMTKDTEASCKEEDFRIGISSCKSESISQLNVHRTGPRTLKECSENATDALP